MFPIITRRGVWGKVGEGFEEIKGNGQRGFEVMLTGVWGKVREGFGEIPYILLGGLRKSYDGETKKFTLKINNDQDLGNFFIKS